ncbi:hypothetical protein [Kitasatospora sp. MMS16-BH015]|uniref:hypothetical protein n=1 Tax=Kitasatospora sp. MMS16-BH015 TaxID=2018025 RepID=UPI000CF2D687|nr:hypothetical protein [Kitasatospora sp. MMS16-BH015]
MVAAVAVQLDSRAAYSALILANALSYLLTAVIAARLPHLAPVPTPPGASKRVALRDRRYLAFTALSALTGLQGDVLLFVLPLWIVGHTDAPHWLVGATALLNTLMVVALQVRTGRDVRTDTDAARLWRRAGWAFLAGMTLTAFATGQPAWLAALLLLLGMAVHTTGELWQAVGSFELRYSLAPAHAQGEYAGVLKLGTGIADALAPSLLALLCLTWGRPGWLLLGTVLALAGHAVPHLLREPRPA